MGAHSNHDQPLFFALLDPVAVYLRVLEIAKRDRLRLLHFGFGAAADEDRLATPLDCYRLADLDPRKVDFDRAEGQNVGRRVHDIDEWPGGGGDAKCRHRGCGEH